MKTRIFMMLVTLLALVGCKSKPEHVERVNIGDKQVSLDQLYSSMAQTYTSWTDCYVPVSVSLQSPGRMSVSGRVTMVRNQGIHLSLRILGIEAGWLYITNDSVYAADKYHKYYVAEGVRHLLKGYDLTVGNIQDLLLGQAFVPTKSTAQAKYARELSLHEAEDGTLWTMAPKADNGPVRWEGYATVSMPPVLNGVHFVVNQQAEVAFAYSDQVQTPAGIAAKRVDIGADLPKKPIRLSWTWNMNNAKWDTKRTIDFSRPRGYEKVSAEQLLKSLKSL